MHALLNHAALVAATAPKPPKLDLSGFHDPSPQFRVAFYCFIAYLALRQLGARFSISQPVINVVINVFTLLTLASTIVTLSSTKLVGSLNGVGDSIATDVSRSHWAQNINLGFGLIVALAVVASAYWYNRSESAMDSERSRQGGPGGRLQAIVFAVCVLLAVAVSVDFRQFMVWWVTYPVEIFWNILLTLVEWPFTHIGFNASS